MPAPCGACAWLLIAALAGRAEPVAVGPETVYGRAARDGGTAAIDAPAGQPERIVATALAGLARAESVSARVRQKVRVGNRSLVGSGRYFQFGTGIDQRFRYEWSMQCDTETFELLEVCDGVHAWTYRRVGPEPTQLERVDVRRVREKLEDLGVLDRLGASPYLGGIQRSLALLRTWFRFDEVASASIDDVAVWSVEGRWRPERLAELLPQRAEAIRASQGIDPADLPDGMPWGVRLSIGKRELFPFRVEWIAIPGDRPVAPRAPEPIAVLELYDVTLGGPVDMTAFVYKPATAGMIDVTDGLIERLQPLLP